MCHLLSRGLPTRFWKKAIGRPWERLISSGSYHEPPLSSTPPHTGILRPSAPSTPSVLTYSVDPAASRERRLKHTSGTPPGGYTRDGRVQRGCPVGPEEVARNLRPGGRTPL